MLIINNWTPIIYNLNFKYSPEPIIYNRELYIMKPHGSSINKPGSKYSPGPIIYNWSLFKTGATDRSSQEGVVAGSAWKLRGEDLSHPF